MADITMCEDKECSKAKECYRFNAVPNKWRQSYFIKTPRQGDKCKEFVPNTESGK